MLYRSIDPVQFYPVIASFASPWRFGQVDTGKLGQRFNLALQSFLEFLEALLGKISLINKVIELLVDNALDLVGLRDGEVLLAGLGEEADAREEVERQLVLEVALVAFLLLLPELLQFVDSITWIHHPQSNILTSLLLVE